MTRPNKPDQIIIIPVVSIVQIANVQLIPLHPTKYGDGYSKEGNVLFNDALNTFYLRLYDVEHMIKDHSDSERGNPLPPHGLLFPYRIPFSCIYIYIHVSQCLSAVYQTEKTQDWIPPRQKKKKNPQQNTKTQENPHTTTTKNNNKKQPHPPQKNKTTTNKQRQKSKQKTHTTQTALKTKKQNNNKHTDKQSINYFLLNKQVEVRLCP